MRLHHPDFPTRRAFFLESKSRMEIYAQGGERLAEDLRHEVTHGYLHSVVPNLPLWLDEGLAKYYEVPRGRHGLNRPLIELFKNRPPSKPWNMNWRRLEKIQARRRDDPGRLRRSLGVGPLPARRSAGIS